MKNTVPQYITKYFWEYDTNALNFEQYASFVIERILEKGDMKAIKWLFQNYSKEKVQNVINNSCNLSSTTINFWHIFFKNINV